ncbi:jagged-2-like isoform X2 [Paramuricea clavata]|uniref:Delta-like protein n=1 Tax=Paramuricea clavata TaxID=317549 RepID=A0A7D9HLH1_PARCT|nr:jagged-2-like isoform X2 [Paramuricea clavata]
MASLSQRFLWIVFLWYFRIDEVDLMGEVVLEVLLTRFSNPQNRNALNQCCDDKKNALTCADSCDIFFVVCVPPQVAPACSKSGVILRNSSEFISSQENFTFSSGNTVGNFLSVPFKTDPQRSIQFSIHFYDDDSSTGLPDLGNQSSLEAVINHTETTVKYKSIRRNISKSNISFEFLYRLHLKCAKNFHGSLCDKYCKPMNNNFGHYECLFNGTLKCLPGWKEPPPCTTPICPGGCGGIKRGTCYKPNTCRCYNGWKEPSCTECIPPPNCVHATCTDPHVGGCHCKANWTGQDCNVYMDYCSHFDPCKNGNCLNNNVHNFTCVCHSGWYGPKCERSLCSPSCNRTNAVCASLGECSCKAGWTGPNCTQCIPTTNCTHGYCNKPFECLCEEGWSGENCTEPVRKSSCSSQNPCQNGGSCIDVAMSNYHCHCKPGFTGRHCQDKVLNPCSKWCNESHGYCEDNECKCHPGWQGPNCTECIKNSSCVNGYCRQPFECICDENWTGPICNCTNECTPGITNKMGSGESISDTDKLIYILSSVMVLLIIACLLCLVRRHHRKRAIFHVPSSGDVFANNSRPSYITGNNQGENGFTLNNNVSAKSDYTSCGVVLNPMNLQPSQNSRSMLIDNESEIYESNGAPKSTEYCII